MGKPVLVITGGLGRVGTLLQPKLSEHYRLRVVDRGNALDLSDPRVALSALDGADAVLHLAGQANPRTDWATAFAANVLPTSNLLEAAAVHKVPRIVLASSLHAMGEYNRPEHWPVNPALTPRPCCPYGLSKVVVETLGQVHAHTTGASVVCLRLGLVGWPVTEERYVGQWLSDVDAFDLVRAALIAEVNFGVYFGTSANTRNRWDLTTTRAALGYQPLDDDEQFAATAGPATERLCGLFNERHDS